MQSAPDRKAVRQTPRTAVIDGFADPVVELIVPTNSIVIRCSGRSAVFTIVFGSAFLGLAIGGWICVYGGGGGSIM